MKIWKRLICTGLAVCLLLGGAVSGYATSPPIRYRYGDADHDWTITTTDARLVLQHCVGKAEGYGGHLSDVDGDGAVTTTDARLILQAAAGKRNYSYVGAFQEFTFRSENGIVVEITEKQQKPNWATGARGYDGGPYPY